MNTGQLNSEKTAADAPLAIRVLFGIYRKVISPVMHGLHRGLNPAAPAGSVGCRFQPTCSEYAAVAVTRHGFLRGSWLAVRRLLKCHPFSGRSGFDPVPDLRVKQVEDSGSHGKSSAEDLPLKLRAQRMSSAGN